MAMRKPSTFGSPSRFAAKACGNRSKKSGAVRDALEAELLLGSADRRSPGASEGTTKALMPRWCRAPGSVSARTTK